MYIDYSSWDSYEYKLSSLYLDVNNPRIRYRGENLNQTQIIKLLIEKEKVYELAKKISEEGYFVGESPIICIEKNKKVVLEGNRRTAALKILQNPKKYLPIAKANILIKNITANNFPVDNKIRCDISPNRLLANPIIYERHRGDSLKKWVTGNQYDFVAELYYGDGLSIEDICDVLNEKRSRIIQPLKAYNLFFEGKELLEREAGIIIDVAEFDFTNLERFYSYEDARKLIGVEFNNENGELIINLERSEFEKRLLEVFKMLIHAERFSRDFNKEEDKKKLVDELKQNPVFDLNADKTSGATKSKTAEKKTDLEEKKNKVTKRRKRGRKKGYTNFIIPRDKEIIFDNEKLDGLFQELKGLPIDRKYSFCVLIRTYLEQSLTFYISENELVEDLNKKTNEENEKNGLKKVNGVISHFKGKYGVTGEVDPDSLMSILKFRSNKDYSGATLKVMLDYVIKNELINHLPTNKYKNLKDYLERIKSGLDLGVHNIETIIDKEHNKRAWKHLEPLFDILSENIKSES